ncbi:MAG: YidC/Oxa1 family insertase periplasmic-domain containing protein [Gemmataceae bacterium]|nr:YidC/Oxa1 family insertase periplasmic-domain containing protein [Gemmataceae bacterium]
MPTKNLLIFFGLSLVIVTGWTAFSAWKWPPPQKLPTSARELVLSPRQVEQVRSAAAIATAGAAGLGFDGAAGQIVTEVAVIRASQPVKPPEVEKPPVVEKPPAEKPDIITFGDSSYKLRVTLSTQGASVRHVVLNQFQAADELGLPMFENGDEQKPTPLGLVPPFHIAQMRKNHLLYNHEYPYYHYTLFHFEKPDDDRPVDTLGKVIWKVKEPATPNADSQRVVFETEVPGQDLIVTKTFTLGKGDYHIGLTVNIRPKGKPRPDQKFRYQLQGAHGLPIEGVWYTYTHRNALVGSVERGTDRNYRSLEDSRQISFWSGGDAHVRSDKKIIRYAGIAVQYFASVVVIDNEQAEGVSDNFIERVRATVEEPLNPPDRAFLDDITVRLTTEPNEIKPEGVEHRYLLYNGPVKVRQLAQLTGDKAVDPELVNRYIDSLHLNTLTDYQSPGWGGNFAGSIGLTRAIVFFTNIMHGILWYIHQVIPWWGLCIIALTVIVRGCLFPLSRKQAANSMNMQEKMAKLGPEVKKLQEKYKEDFQGLNQARTELYLRHGINPLSTLGGCLLLFAQMPIFLGLYYCLQESIHFRLNPFLWIPNLAAPDMLIWWGEAIPFISRPQDLGSFIYLGPFFNLLPVIAVGLMIVQQKMMTPPPQDEQQEMQQKMMKWMMIVFGLMFYKVAAGLCIYFIASSAWGVCERKLLPKSKPATPGEEPPNGTPPPNDRKPEPRRIKGDSSAPEPNGFLQRIRRRWDEVLKEAGKQGQARKEPRRDEGDDDNNNKRKKRKR